jgi:predicted O-methyltransferase YrrM
MDPAVATVLAEYDERAAKEPELIRSAAGNFDSLRDELLLRVGPETGRLLSTLVKGAGARRILELGTSYGYSTTWLADAARATGGRVTTLDVVEKKQAYAKAMLGKAGLGGFVDFRLGDALEALESLDGPFDFVLLDIWKDLYVPSLERFYPKLAPGAVVIADNMIQPEAARADAIAYRKAVRAKPGITSILLLVGSGVEVSRLKGPLDGDL